MTLAPCHPNPDGSYDHHYRPHAQPGDPCYCGQVALAEASYFWWAKPEEVEA